MRTLTAMWLGCSLLVTGCSDGGGVEQDLGSDAAIKTPGIAVVRGTLKGGGADGGADGDKAAHDGLVATIKPMVTAAGDTGHTVFLGLADPTAFLSVDAWSDLAAAHAVYATPQFQQAFGSLFTGVPKIDFYVAAPGFLTYGTLKEATNGLPSFGFVVEGTLKDADPAKSAVAHNAVLEPNKAAAMALTDVAHVPYLAEGASGTFFNVDIWLDAQKAQGFFQDPNVGAAFAGLFSVGPTVTPYAATDWVQW